MTVFHNKYSKIFFIVYGLISLLFIVQDLTADKSFFDLSGLGLYILSYPLIVILRLFVDLNIDPKPVLYSIFIFSSIIYYLIVDTVPYMIKK